MNMSREKRNNGKIEYSLSVYEYLLGNKSS